MKPDPVQLLPVLYAAPADSDQWVPFLNGLAEQVHARTTCVIARDVSPDRGILMHTFGADPDAQRLYQSYYGGIDEFFAYAERKGFNRDGTVTPSEAFISERELLNTEYGNDFLLKFDMIHECIALFSTEGPSLANLAVIRGAREGVFSDEQVRIMRFLLPHVQRAIQLAGRFTQVRQESDARKTVLNQIATAVVFLDAHGMVLNCNESAGRILEKHDGLLIANRRLLAQSSIENRQLQAAILQTTQSVAGHVTIPPSALLISRHPPAKPLQIVVGPATLGMAGLHSCPAVVVFIGDRSARLRPHNGVLKTLYGLTPAESRVALLLLDGNSSEEIMSLLCVSKNTLKTQIKSIFDKTEVRRQSQLIRLLMRLPLKAD